MMKKLSVIFLMLFLLSGKTLYGEQPKKAKITPIPKNAHILITSNRDTKDGRSEIYAINTDGSGATRITYSKYHHFILGVDQTTQYIVASRAAEDTTAPKGLGDEDKRSLWIIDTKNKLEQRLTDSKNHAEGDSFSPDGEWIVFLMKRKDKEQSDIYKIKRDGTQLTPLTDTPAAIEGDPAWSHSGKEIVFAYLDQKTPRFVIKIMDSQGKNIRTVYDGGHGVSTPVFPAGNYDPEWSPDDQWIVFERATSSKGENWGNGIWHILKVDRDGKSVVDLSQSGKHSEWAEFLPSFSPDGQFVVFSAFYQAPDPKNSLDDILVMKADGTSVFKVTTHPKSDKYPVWIPARKT